LIEFTKLVPAIFNLQMQKPYPKSLTPQQALLKAAAFCAYQERCYQEVEAKLSEWGIFGTDAGELMIKLSEQNYLNEERFAKAFAGGKFRTKKWGRNKIRLALKQKKISDYCINIGMKEIDETAYSAILTELATQKLASFSGSNPLIQKNKTAQWLMAKGFEADLIWDILKKLT
jgi:regulatory protein